MPSKLWNFLDNEFTISGFDDTYFHGIGLHNKHDVAYYHLVKRFTKNGSVALDIGANIGKTALIASVCHPDLCVVAFEPGNNNFRLLEENIRQNNISNVTLVHSAVGSKNLAKIAFNDASAWGGVRVDTEPNEDSPPCITIDQYFEKDQEQIGRPVSWVKIDVEGHEWEVIKGMNDVIKGHSPVVFMEFNMYSMVGVENIRVLDFLGELSLIFKYSYRLELDDVALAYKLSKIDLSTLAGKRKLIHGNIVHRRGVEDIILSVSEIQ